MCWLASSELEEGRKVVRTSAAFFWLAKKLFSANAFATQSWSFQSAELQCNVLLHLAYAHGLSNEGGVGRTFASGCIISWLRCKRCFAKFH